MTEILKVERFRGQVDSNTPLFNRDPGWMKTLQNLRSKPGGHVEARGGYEELKPSGGTTASIDSQGIIAGFHEHFQTHGCVIGDIGGTFTTDIAHFGSYRLFGTANDLVIAPPMITSNNLGNAWYFGSTGKFSRLRIVVAQGTAGAYTVTWKYSKGAGVWGNLTSPTEDFKTTGTKEISWRIDSDWVPYSVNNIYLYWVRCEITTAGASAADCWVTNAQILSDWPGRRMLFGAATSGAAGAANGKLRFYGQTTGGVANWSDAFVGATTLFSGNDPRFRLATYQNRLLYVNGKENQRYNNDRATDLGFTPPVTAGFTIAAVANPSNFGQAAIFDYGISFGYGPGGSWGESTMVRSATGPTAFAAGDQAQLAWTSTGSVAGQTEVVYLYRTQDLTGVPVSARTDQPLYRIQTLYKVSPLVVQLAAIDFNYGFPFPAAEPIVYNNIPPSRCQFIHSFKGRVLLARNDEFPARGFWSDVVGSGGGESFDKDNNYLDLAYTGGGGITGSATAFDTWWLWNENAMLGVADLDEDIPNIFEQPGGVGCIAPDAVGSRYGVLIWPSRDGIYLMTMDGQIRRISDDQSLTFGRMSLETHGRSRAQMYDAMYDIQLLDQNGAPVSGASRWRFDLVTGEWHTISVSLSPLAVVTAPLGHADQGVSHPIFGNTNPQVADRKPYVGEYTTTDAGTGFDCIADIHFGPPGFQKFSPRRFAAYFQADGGWNTPVISTPPGATYIFKTPAGFGTGTSKTGTDYSVIVSNNTEKTSGSQDIMVRFKATTAGAGTLRNQRLIAAYLEGTPLQVHPTG